MKPTCPSPSLLHCEPLEGGDADARHRHYRQDGAIMLQQVLTEEDWHPLLVTLDQRLALLENHYGLMAPPLESQTPDMTAIVAALSQRLIALETRHPGTQSACYEAMANSPAIHGMANHPKLLKIAESLLGTPLVSLHTRLLVLMSMPGQEWHLGAWHQDWHYNQGPYSTLTLYAPLQPVCQENGSLLLALGEHQKGPMPHASNDHGLDTKWQTLSPETSSQFERMADTQVAVGDVLCFNSLTPHSARKNHSQQVRFVLNLRYFDLTDPAFIEEHWQPALNLDARAAMQRKGPA